MAQKKLVDHNALLQAIEAGVPKQELMQEFGYKSLSALKVGCVDALEALGKIPVINKQRRKRTVSDVLGINSRGSLVIPKKLVDALGLDTTALFRVTKNGAGLLLKETRRPPKTILRKKSQSK